MAVLLWIISTLVLVLNGKEQGTILFAAGQDTVVGEWTIFENFQYFRYEDRKMKWGEGLAFCRKQKPTAFLARPTRENVDFLKGFGYARMYLSDHHFYQNNWLWSDNSSLPADAAAWYSGYPKYSHIMTSGIFYRYTGELLNADPLDVYSVICQAPLETTTTSPTTTPHQTTTTEQPTTAESTTTEPTTIEPITTKYTTTERTTTERTTTELTTLTEPTSTPEPSSTTKLTSTTEPSTTNPVTTAEPTTTTEPTTTEPATTTELTTTEPVTPTDLTTTEATTTEPTTKPEPTTTPHLSTTTPFQPTTPPSFPCPTTPGWLDIQTPSGRCYYLSSSDPDAQPLDWRDAFLACKASQTASLGSVPNALDFYLLVFRLRREKSDAWMGLLDIGDSRSWVDGTLYADELDQFVAKNDTDGMYGFVSATDGMFHFLDGTDKHPYICSIVPPSPSPGPDPSTSPSPRPSPTTPAPACVDPWLEFSGRCYLFVNESQYWATAGHNCSALGGHFVSIHDAPVLTFLLLHVEDTIYWTGLQHNGDTFAWADGSTTEDISNIKGFLDDWEEDKNCVAISQVTFPTPLVHQNCFDQKPYICYKESSTGV